MRHLLALLLLLVLAAPCSAASDKYKFNPFTGKLDNVGDGVATAIMSSTGVLICPFIDGDTVTWAACEIPVPPTENRLLAETNDYLTTEGDAFILL